ncbi:MAG TPA: tRNA pseudouridine(13) synthase TruD [Nitrospira sp.]|jgi:tRNA pseudouridine13 synthase|uniref:tRNA pseudouridine(13) synthase TruD n=1 Tax=Nitrospira sp. ND1 TaxID=1658518 RepID=UPI0009BB4BC6|nr:tRNA pseudouridine(13) synthase TruD [Nitrospira sp. ND1]MBK7418756.1 tRNA pseudouridine(13) synthase TruD [Nitrospira sp.]OYT23862.1 MAG: tRNA pseudouridine(13) synthase TruD [Nitrospira sp. UW-LDO-02]MBK7485686.1 tRNA pseudouridine(13) synthase TruD [Nitrospira sp.]MBK8377592.1 tRNA pseudouridine(13) synthase TruD [Nitrospira sp.]MBK9110195.1 tRNA pseudouridine(13) synthase TruD [Nitrospira sp.]
MPPPSWLDDTVPYLTASVPALGGRIRSTPDDFCVEERPLYLPCGEGEHLYIRVKKRGLSTPDLVLRLASQLHVKAQTIGVAGLKDAQAVTTQMLSLQGVKAETISALPTDERLLALEVLGRHRNRLRKGHHAGNQFRLVIRDVRERSEDDLQELFDELVRRGVPNYFGPQRQGRSGTNFQLGAELLQDAARRNKMPRNKRIWFMNAYQSHVFNRIVAKRIESIDRVFLGDWAMKSDNGACFPVEQPEVEQPRADRFEISPTGPLFGSRAPWATGVPGDIEQAVVAELGTTPELLSKAGAECGFRGERRALRVRLNELSWSLEGTVLTLGFWLPPGSYATSVLREVVKKSD